MQMTTTVISPLRINAPSEQMNRRFKGQKHINLYSEVNASPAYFKVTNRLNGIQKVPIFMDDVNQLLLPAVVTPSKQISNTGHKRGNSTLVSNASAAPILHNGKNSSQISENGGHHRGLSHISSLRVSCSNLGNAPALENFCQTVNHQEDVKNSEGDCYLKTKTDKFKKHTVVIHGNEIYWFKTMEDPNYQIMHSLVSTYAKL
jgi:hypothetical protein